jgi:hypothetical protein
LKKSVLASGEERDDSGVVEETEELRAARAMRRAMLGADRAKERLQFVGRHPLEALETCYDNSVEYTRWVQCTRCNEGFRMEMVVL